jgi:hypothetical protein
MRVDKNGMRWWDFVTGIAQMQPVRAVTTAMWRTAHAYLGHHPSTGFVAVMMALEAFPVDELLLYGYDATTPDREDYWDARPGAIDRRIITEAPRPPHDMIAEKRALREIITGQWLGKPIATSLTWPDMPEIPE